MAREVDLTFAVLYCVALVFNVTGNSLVLHIISRKQRTATDYLLLNLAIADIVFGAFLSPLFFRPLFASPAVLFEKTFMVASSIGCVTSIGTMLTLSFERYFAVCRPYSFKRWFCKRNVKIFVAVSWLSSIAYILPLCIGELYGNSADMSKVYPFLTVIVFTIIVLLLIVMSIKIYLSLWCKHTVIQPTALRELQETKKKKRVTICVLTVVMTFLLFYVPHSIVQLFADYSVYDSNYQLAKVTTLGLTINAALDPYLFSLQNSRLKVMLKRMFLCKSNEHAPPQHADQ